MRIKPGGFSPLDHAGSARLRLVPAPSGSLFIAFTWHLATCEEFHRDAFPATEEFQELSERHQLRAESVPAERMRMLKLIPHVGIPDRRVEPRADDRKRNSILSTRYPNRYAAAREANRLYAYECRDSAIRPKIHGSPRSLIAQIA